MDTQFSALVHQRSDSASASLKSTLNGLSADAVFFQ